MVDGAPTSWLTPIGAALDARTEPIEVFVRDDDAGWAHDRLLAMLDVFAAHAMHIDLAVIPDALDEAVAASLLEHHARGRVHLHQHGRSHTNHEPPDRRKCEFGPARTVDELRADVRDGWRRLRSLLGDAVEPVFTPPWNRSVDGLADALREAGHEVLSRDASAGTIGHPGVREVPVTLDWFGSAKGERRSRETLGERIAEAAAGDGPIGLMLHHGVTDDEELAAVDALIELLAQHPNVRSTSILAVAGATARR